MSPSGNHRGINATMHSSCKELNNTYINTRYEHYETRESVLWLSDTIFRIKQTELFTYILYILCIDFLSTCKGVIIDISNMVANQKVPQCRNNLRFYQPFARSWKRLFWVYRVSKSGSLRVQLIIQFFSVSLNRFWNVISITQYGIDKLPVTSNIMP